MQVGTYHNLEKLNEITGGDKEFETVMIQTFCEEAESLVSEMRTAYEAGNLEAMGRSAHGLKPNAQIFGIASIHESLVFVENNGKAGNNAQELEEKIDEINRVIEQVVKELS